MRYGKILVLSLLAGLCLSLPARAEEAPEVSAASAIFTLTDTAYAATYQTLLEDEGNKN